MSFFFFNYYFSEYYFCTFNRFKGGGVKTCSVLTPAEEEDDDPFGGVYLGPPDSLPPKKSVQFNR